MRSGVFLTKFEMLGIKAVKYCLECLIIFSLETRTKEKQGAGLNISYPVSYNNAESEIYEGILAK